MDLKKYILKFMAGRNGLDMLAYAVLAIYFLLSFINAFLVSSLVRILMTLLAVYAMFRTFSKDVNRRQAENQRFLALWQQAKGRFNRLLRRVKEIKTHRYRQCPQCHATLRLPRKTGEHSVVCPRCKHRWSVHIYL